MGGFFNVNSANNAHKCSICSLNGSFNKTNVLLKTFNDVKSLWKKLFVRDKNFLPWRKLNKNKCNVLLPIVL